MAKPPDSYSANLLARICWLAAAYFLTGKLGLLLATPPGYATSVWPAAGIALGAVLLLGYRVWPGIFVGSFLINIETSLAATHGSPFTAFILTAGIAAGATLQAALGAGLILRRVGFPTPLDRTQDIFRSLALAGPLSCLVSSTIGVTCLWAAGLVQPAESLGNWGTWWLGDTIGVLVVLPLASAWRLEAQQGRVRKRLTVFLPLGLAAAVTVLVFLHVRTVDWKRAQLEFAGRTTHLTHALTEALHGYLDDLYAIEGLFMSSRRVERTEFSEFVQRLFRRHPGLKALEWAPRVPAAQKDQFLLAARQEGYPEFQFTELNEAGQIVPVAPRPEYFPVYYLEPYQGNESALGFDLASNPLRLEALEQARDKLAAFASARIKLVQETGEQFGFLVFLPIYTKSVDLDSLQARRDHLTGYALGVFRTDEMVHAALAPFDLDGIEYGLFDETGPPGEQLLFTNTLPSPGNSGSNLETSQGAARPVLYSQNAIEFAGRRWEMRFTPTPAYLAELAPWEAKAVLIGGLLFTSLLGTFLLVVAGRTAMIERVVHERTSDLSLANSELAREISERRRINEALRESEARHRAIVDNAVDGIVTIDQRAVVQSFNPAAERIFGYSAQEVVGRNVKMLQPEPFHSHHDAYIENYLHTGKAKIIGIGREVSGRRKDGTTFPLDLSVSEVRLGERRLFTGILRDITRRKQDEENLRRANEKLKEIDRLKSMFIASMSHELRTPLNSIIGFSSILINEWAGPLNDEQRENLATVVRTGKHLLALINDVIDVSKIEAGQLDVHVDAFDLHDVIEEAAQTLAGQADTQGLQLQVENIHHPMNSDRLRLLQCVLNLLSNAIKYTRQGSIHVCAQILAAQNGQRQEVKISVKDTGIGIGEEDQPKVFQPFVRFDSPLKNTKPGTGLGLYLTHKLVREVLHGDLEFESHQGSGSLFCIVIPDSLEET